MKVRREGKLLQNEVTKKGFTDKVAFELGFNTYDLDVQRQGEQAFKESKSMTVQAERWWHVPDLDCGGGYMGVYVMYT